MVTRGHDKIVNTESLLRFQGGVNLPPYPVSKSAVAGLTKALADERALDGVHINAFALGYVATANTRDLLKDTARSKEILRRIPAGRWAEASDTGAALFLCSHAAEFVQRVTVPVDGGWLAR